MDRHGARRRAAASAAVTLSAAGFTWWWATQTGWLTPECWFGVSFLVLGWAVTLSDVLRFQIRLPNAYHRLRGFEAGGGLYRAIGVRVFKRFVVNGDYMNRAKRARDPHYRLIRTRSDALQWESRSRAAEAAHMLHLILLSPAIVLALRAGRISFAAWTLVLLVGFDLYPVLLQRYNRARLTNVAAARKTIRAGRAGAGRGL